MIHIRFTNLIDYNKCIRIYTVLVKNTFKSIETIYIIFLHN